MITFIFKSSKLPGLASSLATRIFGSIIQLGTTQLPDRDNRHILRLPAARISKNCLTCTV